MSEERHYIRKHDYKGRKGYQLVIPASDTGNLIYIRHGKDLSELKKVRDEILNRNLTEAQIQQEKQKYKKPRREPMIEQYIKKTADNRYNVRNNEKKHKGSYGVYNTIQEARKIRDKLIQNNWNREKAGVTLTRRSRTGPDRYIYHEHGKYTIKRFKNKKNGKQEAIRYETGIRTIEEARQIRDWWEEQEWNWENIDLI